MLTLFPLALFFIPSAPIFENKIYLTINMNHTSLINGEEKEKNRRCLLQGQIATLSFLAEWGLAIGIR